MITPVGRVRLAQLTAAGREAAECAAITPTPIAV